MISRRFIVMVCFLLPLLLNNCSFLSEDLDAEGETIDAVEEIIESGNIQNIESVKAQINEHRRKQIQRNHTATHLIHQTIKDVLGDHQLCSALKSIYSHQ